MSDPARGALGDPARGSPGREGAAERARAVFERGSRTYYNASRVFPEEFREPLATLYAFVRSADDYVDAVPQDAEGFMAFRARWNAARSGTPTGDEIVDRFAALAAEKGFDPAWTEAFLDAMQADLTVRAYDSEEAVLGYIYGSAEVIGLYMTALIGLPEESLHGARMLGRSMQYVNFIRDFDEDRRLGRRYLPLNGADPRVSDPDWARAHPDEFAAYLRSHIARYKTWGAEGRSGFRYLPGRYRAAIATAQDMYDWSARRIEKNPVVVFDRQMKPPKWLVIARGALNFAIMGRARPEPKS